MEGSDDEGESGEDDETAEENFKQAQKEKLEKEKMSILNDSTLIKEVNFPSVS